MTRIMDYIGQVRPWAALGYSIHIAVRFYPHPGFAHLLPAWEKAKVFNGRLI